MDGAYNDVLSQWYARPGNVDIEKGLPYGSTILNANGTAPATSPATRNYLPPHRHRLTKSTPYPGHEDEYLSRLRVTRSDPVDVEDCLNPKNCPYHPNVTRIPLHDVNTFNGTVRASEPIPTYHDEEPVKPKNFARWMMPIFGHVPRNPSIVSSVAESEKGKRRRSRGSYYFCRRCMIFECVCWLMFIIVVVFVPVYILYVMNASPAQLYSLSPPEPQVIPGTPPSTIFPWFRDPPGEAEPDPVPSSPHIPFDDSGLNKRHISDRVVSSSEAPLILSRIARFGRRPHHGTIKEAQGTHQPEPAEHDRAKKSPLLNPIVEPFPISFTASEVSSIPDQSTRRHLAPSGIQQEITEFLEYMSRKAKRYMDPHHWLGSKVGLGNKLPTSSEVQNRDNEAGMDAGLYGWFKSTLGSFVVQERANEASSQSVKKYMGPHRWFGSKLEESPNGKQPSVLQKIGERTPTAPRDSDFTG